MIYRGDFDYDSHAKIQEFTDELYEQLKALVPGLPEEKKDHIWGTYLFTQDALQFCFDHKIVLSVKSINGTYSPQKPLEGWKALPPEVRQESVVHVHIPNIGLMMINEVIVREDCCTEALQDLLNEGWRILAVCPPNGVRRPDYILGRTRND